VLYFKVARIDSFVPYGDNKVKLYKNLRNVIFVVVHRNKLHFRFFLHVCLCWFLRILYRSRDYSLNPCNPQTAQLQGSSFIDTINYLTVSPLIPLWLHTLSYWSNPPFLIFDIGVLWRPGLSARAPQCQKLKMFG